MSATHTRTTLASNGVDFVDENDAWCIFLRFRKKVTYAARANTDKHFYKFRTRDRKEWHIRLARYSARQQRFTSTWMSDQQHALWNLRPKLLVFLWMFQKIYHFMQILLGIVVTRHVRKDDFFLILPIQTRFTLAKTHRLIVLSLRLTHHKHKERHDHHYRDDHNRQIPHHLARRRRWQHAHFNLCIGLESLLVNRSTFFRRTLSRRILPLWRHFQFIALDLQLGDLTRICAAYHISQRDIFESRSRHQRRIYNQS